MSCENYRSHLVALLYDDIGGDDRDAVAAHLAACSSCRETLASLETTRGAVRDATMDVPRAPRVLVVGRAPAPARAWLGFAAGLAAALLAAGGAAAGYAFGGGRDARAPAPSDGTAAALVEKEVGRRMRTLEAALAAARAESATGTSDAITREDLEAAMLRLEHKIDGSRASDIDYVENLINASERRTGGWIGETQKALRYVALANNPGLSER